MQQSHILANDKKTAIPLVDPVTHDRLEERDGVLYNGHTRKAVAKVIAGIPRFVDESYADNFAFQWKHWRHTLSDMRSLGSTKLELIKRRTRFDQYHTEGATLLECGMGGGDDTEVLLRFPFSEIHGFDISTAVDRAAAYLHDPRLKLLQASIYEIPYPDSSFDFVYCHRVLQHTPDPQRALRAICRKVKPGGVLFAHCYKKSWRYLMNYKYKCRWLTKRIPYRYVYWYVETFGQPLHLVNAVLHRCGPIGRSVARQFVPFEYIREYGNLDKKRLLELEKLVTFDALTPRHDHPMTSRQFRHIIEGEGFRIEHIRDPRVSPLYCTAVRIGD